jgi:AAA+ ATPase superfamily predicted ATPase
VNTVRQFLENRIHVVLIGPRRFGKTSFILNLLKGLKKDGFTCLFVDIFNITSHRDFLQQMLRALRLKNNWLKDPKGDIKEAIQDLLEGLEKLGKRVILTIDEFQKITQINDQGWLEVTLRTYMQKLKNTSFLFTGSRKSIIYDMLNNHTRPLYCSCQLIEFPSFDYEFTDWVIARFLKVGIKC